MSLDLFRVDGGLQIDSSVQITEGSGAPSHDAVVGSTYHRTDSGGVYVKVAAGSGTDKWELQAFKSYVDSEISAVQAAVNSLGNAFNYVGVLTGGDQSTPYDLDTLPAAGKDSGDYYKVTTAGWFVVGAGSPFYANVGDGLVFNVSGSVDKIDNTNSEVSGTTSYVTVSGSTDTGYVVDLDSAFKNRVSSLETSLAAEVTARTDADSTLTSAILAETTARQSADTLLQGNIDAETTARIAGDAANAAAIAAETTARVAADSLLQAAIDAETSARIAAIAAEATARTDSDVALQNEINSLIAATLTTTATNVTSASDTVTAVAAKWVVYVKQTDTPANVNAYEIFAATNGVDVDYTRFSILKLGVAISGLTTSVAVVASDLVLTVGAGVNVDVSIKRVSVI